MHGYGKVGAQGAQLRVGPPAIAHVVFCMYFQPLDRAGIGAQVSEMLGFVSHSGGDGQAAHRGCRIQHGVAFRKQSVDRARRKWAGAIKG